MTCMPNKMTNKIFENDEDDTAIWDTKLKIPSKCNSGLINRGARFMNKLLSIKEVTGHDEEAMLKLKTGMCIHEV